ncbi:hypothetical protein PQ472_02290 [Lacticaseibacillus pabuli]|uniref:Integral membrane protein n=1 Tax=Lacticaseibacillus pabuli TaxID=3025672 RepID=A0ABY7WSD8_9LACO|nr:hypothetical protein [Lacticaseibacillus sp. KACC 23028]WDF83082.1 hypothetical protein PQ472_02290 [Lacticaseibacillus sp. KACC 23028]
MRSLRKFLYWLNIVGMIAYLIVCGYFQMTGKPLYPGQVGLMFQVASGLVLVSIPLIIEKWAHVALPDILVVLYELFILMAILLGTGMQAYSIPNWDKFEHLFSAGMLAGSGFMIYAARTPADKQDQIDPFLIALFGAAFGVLLGVCWEFYEFTGDSLFGMNMQRYMAAGKPLIGHPVLYDTMGDLLSDFIGSAGMSLYAFFKIRRDHSWLNTFKLHRIK